MVADIDDLSDTEKVSLISDMELRDVRSSPASKWNSSAKSMVMEGPEFRSKILTDDGRLRQREFDQVGFADPPTRKMVL